MGHNPPLPAIEVRSLSSPSPVKPVLVCGLPGSGYVGKLAADYIVTAFKAEKFAELYCTSFPPHVNIDEGGVALRLKGEHHLAKTGQENDMIVFTADAQPSTSEGEYALADAVLGLAKKLEARLVFSLAAYVTGGFVKERHVFGTANSAEAIPLLAKGGVQVMKEGGISGMNGVIVGMARLFGMDGVSLLGETSGYLMDPAASNSVLDCLCKILGVKMDLSSIQERAKEAQQIFNRVQGMAEPGEEVPGKREEGRPGYIA